MNRHPIQPYASRLSAIDKSKELLPFVRASTIEDISLYWIPVESYPLPARQRRWMLRFLPQLKDLLASKYELREECFLQFKTLYPDLLPRFTEKAREYMPMTGVSLTPGQTPPALPGFEEIKEQVEQSSKKGAPLDVHRWMPDHTHWFLIKDSEAQREDFFGHGGMFMLYLKQDTKTQPPVLKLPKIATSHPAFSPHLEKDLAAAYSLKDAFLAKSKALFGEPFRSDPSFDGLLFVLPLLNSASFMNATVEQRAVWFDVFDGYCIESKADRGVLLALKEPDFDDHLVALLQAMREAGDKY
ncbi:MAG TPA: hypothetical protein VHT24_11645 [Pseudacidobacterium sp.]|jgi:hypothetical protein|nr:hypothetical protein [Pseudacidobacterium sp.]